MYTIISPVSQCFCTTTTTEGGKSSVVLSTCKPITPSDKLMYPTPFPMNLNVVIFPFGISKYRELHYSLTDQKLAAIIISKKYSVDACQLK